MQLLKTILEHEKEVSVLVFEGERVFEESELISAVIASLKKLPSNLYKKAMSKLGEKYVDEVVQSHSTFFTGKMMTMADLDKVVSSVVRDLENSLKHVNIF